MVFQELRAKRATVTYIKTKYIWPGGSKVGRLRICHLWKFEWNRRGTESKKREKGGKKSNAVATGNRTLDLSITDQMDVLTNQVLLKIQFRHRFDKKCQTRYTDSKKMSEFCIQKYTLNYSNWTADDFRQYLHFGTSRYQSLLRGEADVCMKPAR